MTNEMWNALDSIEDCINRLLAIRDVVSLNTLSNEEIVKLISAMVDMFSEKQKIVWEQYRTEREATEEHNAPEFAKHYRQLTNDYIELETKYKKLALYDTRDMHIEDLTKENAELIQKNELLQKEIEEVKASAHSKNFGKIDQVAQKVAEENGNLTRKTYELTIEKEYYRDQYNQLLDKYERLESKYARLEEDHNNFVNTARTIAQHPSHD